MPRILTPKSSLESLKGEAKRWLKALRANDRDATERFRAATPNAPRAPALRDVQHALACELGFASWRTLKEHLATRPPDESAAETLDALDPLVVRFLDNACPDHHVRGKPDHVRAQHTAMRLLARYPEIAHASLQTAIVCGELAVVERLLAEQPDVASRADAAPSDAQTAAGDSGDLYQRTLGPKGWQPLLYLCFTRLPLAAANENAVAIARLLVDRGADPNAFFMAGDSVYTPLVGAIGEGEEDRPAHPMRDALVTLLLERGANPYDMQVVYNMRFRGRVLWYLELIYAWAARRGQLAEWNDPEWMMLNLGAYGSGARVYLGIAIEHGDVALAGWCLAHGASPNARAPRDSRAAHRSLYEDAVRRGQTEIAELLVQYGATREDVTLSELERFVIAATTLNRADVQTMLAANPALVNSSEPLLQAARHDRADVVALLLDLGVSPDVASRTNERGLHAAAYDNSVNTARLLLERGAEVDPIESSWGNTPLAAAVYSQNRAMIDLLTPYSRDIWELVYSGKIERVRELLAELAGRAAPVTGSNTPLMWLPPDDEALAIRMAELLLAHGMDPSVQNTDQMTAADRAERLGMWMLAELLRRAERAPRGPMLIARLERFAENLVEAYRTGTPEAMRRHWSDTWHLRDWQAMRRYVQLDLGRHGEPGGAEIDVTIDDARLLVAREHGYENWQALTEQMMALPPGSKQPAVKPVKLYSVATGRKSQGVERTRDWDAAIAALKDGRAAGIDAAGQMTNELLERLSYLEGVVSLRLAGSPALTDAGIRHLARMPQLRELDVSGCAISDGAFAVLEALPSLETLEVARTGLTDAGAAKLAACERLVRVDLSGTNTGDGALRALAGKAALRHVRSGERVTDAGLTFLDDFPVYKKWHGGEVAMALLSPDAEPNSLMLRGSFTDRGLASLAGLEGLFGLNVDDRKLTITAAGLAPLVALPHLGFLGVDATDEMMPIIAAMPALRFILCQDTAAGDDGFAALSASQSIEYIWGRRCYNLQSRGFAALATMPALRGLSVSCKNVNDDGLAALPRFPALRELMPIDVRDDGYHFIGQCTDLTALILMYCRDTTDVATEQIAGLTRLEKYFASYTQITDRTPELLSQMASLERIELSACPGVTSAGVAALVALPRLRELILSGLPNVSRASLPSFGPTVAVEFSP